MAVKETLTKRPKRERDLRDIAGMCRRVIRSFGTRVAAADPEDLVELLALHQAVDAAIADAVVGMRSGVRDASWGEIGRALGISRQAAQQRFGVRSERTGDGALPGRLDLWQ